VNLQSAAGKALLRLTRQQFAFWEDQLKQNATGKFKASHSLHYWFILAAIALEGDDRGRILKKRAEEALPQCTWETGRKYLQKCHALGLAETVTNGKIRYVALTEPGMRAVAMTLGRWAREIGALGMSSRTVSDADEGEKQRSAEAAQPATASSVPTPEATPVTPSAARGAGEAATTATSNRLVDAMAEDAVT